MDKAIVDSLTDKDKKLLDMLTLGMSNAEIAEELLLSVYGARDCIITLRRKLGLPDRQAVGSWWRSEITFAARQALLNDEAMIAFKKGIALLSPKQREVLEAMANQPNVDLGVVAKSVHISYHTLRTHVDTIAKKCGMAEKLGDGRPGYKCYQIVMRFNLLRSCNAVP